MVCLLCILCRTRLFVIQGTLTRQHYVDKVLHLHVLLSSPTVGNTANTLCMKSFTCMSCPALKLLETLPTLCVCSPSPACPVQLSNFWKHCQHYVYAVLHLHVLSSSQTFGNTANTMCMQSFTCMSCGALRLLETLPTLCV